MLRLPLTGAALGHQQASGVSAHAVTWGGGGKWGAGALVGATMSYSPEF